jgi:hypothetical protein
MSSHAVTGHHSSLASASSSSSCSVAQAEGRRAVLAPISLTNVLVGIGVSCHKAWLRVDCAHIQ